MKPKNTTPKLATQDEIIAALQAEVTRLKAFNKALSVKNDHLIDDRRRVLIELNAWEKRCAHLLDEAIEAAASRAVPF